VNFSDPQLEECYARKFTLAAGFSGEMRQVCALIAVHDFFQMMEGPHSARAHETIDHLRSPNLRRGLRDWYRHCGAKLTPVEIEFREQLSRLTRENLEYNDMPVNPS
jgi:hypothetical protein